MNKIALYSVRMLALVFALIASVFWADYWRSGIHREKLVHGSDIDRLSLLLEDYLNVAGNLDWNFRKPIDDQTRKVFGSVLMQLNFEKDCSRNGSHAIDGAMRCEVNGFKIDYIESSH